MRELTPQERAIRRRQARERAQTSIDYDKIVASRQPLLNQLDQQGIPYQIEVWQTQTHAHPTDPSQLWLEQHFVFHAGGRIDWNFAREVYERHETTFNFDHGQFIKQVSERAGLANPQVTVLWANFLSPNLKINLQDLIPVASKVVTQDFWDCWIFDEQDSWCIEYHHDGHLRFGYSGSR
ncbi:MAG: hypothetical protein D6675_04760 [Gemmatimonadetes bacterium]|nr:MAG: hypothetical protein D6675_04760 [Gemmatimonadota bacterium]